ncbi:outer membrane protein assembly factor BamE [Palleronia sp.]|uniref:outer membrane protein assembly factor BamE n=1 Tax=Palleronia sp. TaxID=1940284 RepID=UPI0035C85562
MSNHLRLLVAGLLALSLAACSAVYRSHGYVPPDEDLAPLQVGVATREEVAAAVGRPTSTGVLGADSWYYVQSRFRHYGATEPQEVDREVLAISFAENGTLANIERYGLEDGRVVRLSRRTTTQTTEGISFLRQLFSSVGAFNPADFFEEG